MPSVAPQIARRINDRVAMDLLLRRGPMTKGDMRAETGMSQPSVLQLFDRLLADGLIEPAGAVTGRRGPQAHAFRVNPGRATVAVARVSLTETAAGIADMTGQLTNLTTAAPPPDGEGPARQVLDTVRQTIAEAGLATHEISRLVVAATGVIDPRSGDVEYVVRHPEWRGALRQRLEAELGIPVHLENQVNLLGLAELDESPADDFALLSLSQVGGGAAVVINGRLWRGAYGAAGEVAYQPVGADAVVLGPENSVYGGLATLMQEHPWPEGEPMPLALVEPIARVVGSICTVIDPSHVVLAGAIGRRGGHELAMLVEQFLRRTWPMPVAVRPTVVTGDAVLKGAASAGLSFVRDALWGPVTGLTRLPVEAWSSPYGLKAGTDAALA